MFVASEHLPAKLVSSAISKDYYCVCVCACVSVHMWQSEDTCVESLLWFQVYVCSRGGTQAVRLVHPAPLPTEPSHWPKPSVFEMGFFFLTFLDWFWTGINQSPASASMCLTTGMYHQLWCFLSLVHLSLGRQDNKVLWVWKGVGLRSQSPFV